MDVIELLMIGLEAFFAGVCWTFGGMLAEAIYDRLFPLPDDEPPPPSPKPPPARRRKSKSLLMLPLLLVLLEGCASTGCAGCSTLVHIGKPVPGYDTDISCRLEDCEPWSPQHMQEALDLWVVEVGDWFDITPRIPSLIIVENMRDLGPAGDVEHTAGKTLDPFTIQIAGLRYYGMEPFAVSDSAFSHEMCHVMLWAHDGDPDADHADGRGPWTKRHDAMLEDYDNQLEKLQ